MKKRELIDKIISAWEHCVGDEGDCDDCPYNNDFNGCMLILKKDTIDLLKEQEIVPYVDIDEAKCPDCKVKLTRQELLGEDVLFEGFYDFCPHCGKRVKWNA